MDKHTTFKTINVMLSKKHSVRLPLSDESIALICKYESEQMYQIMLSLYEAKNASDEFVKKSIASINKETKKPIGFDMQKE